MRPNSLVLWDIDLTLVDYSGVGRQWYGQAVSAVLGMDITHTPVFPGRTERSITAEILREHGAEVTDANIERVFAELVRICDAADLPAVGRALPGAEAVLAALAARGDVVQSLVTGNLPELADRKLVAFGLDTHIDFDIGGYGSISEHRHDLVSAAVAAAEAKHGTTFDPASVIVIGDTPHDVAAALHHGAVGVGVATGRHSPAELAASGAHLVLDDLSDTPAVVAGLLGSAGSGQRGGRGRLPSGT